MSDARLVHNSNHFFQANMEQKQQQMIEILQSFSTISSDMCVVIIPTTEELKQQRQSTLKAIDQHNDVLSIKARRGLKVAQQIYDCFVQQQLMQMPVQGK